MPETGIEDLIRGDGDEASGCLSIFGGVIVIFVALFIVISIFDYACGTPQSDTNSNVNTHVISNNSK